MPTTLRERLLIIGAFAAIYLVWGSTYLVNYLAIQQIPPFLMCGSRFFLAGALLLATAAWWGVPWPSWRHWRNALLAGGLFLSLGTGGVVWAEQYVDTSMAALVVAFTPLIIVLLVWQIRGQAPQWNSYVGIALGVIGMALLVGQPQLSANRQTLLGLFMIGLSIFSWSLATVLLAKLHLPASKLQTSAMQMLCGGGLLLLASLLTREYATFQPQRLTSQGIGAFFYLVFAGSILAFSAFNYLLSKVPPEQVSTSNYVNPVVAMLLGWGLNHEKITAQSLLAAILLLAGVFFINASWLKKIIKQPRAT